MSNAQDRLAQVAMASGDTSVSELYRELGIKPVTLYRYVGPDGQLREQGEMVLATPNRCAVPRTVSARPVCGVVHEDDPECDRPSWSTSRREQRTVRRVGAYDSGSIW